MKKRDLPKLPSIRSDRIRFDLSASALDRWQPGVQAAAADEGAAAIDIMGVIGEDFWGDGITPAAVNRALRAAGDKPVVVNLNSPGGDYFDGLAIYNRLRQHEPGVTVRVLGMAASAASLIAMSGDEIQIGRAAFFMVHNAWVLAMGDRHFLREAADFLEPFDQAAADVYAARSGIDAGEIAAMMDRETWISGSQAVENGMADAFLPADQIAEPEGSEAKALAPGFAKLKIEIALRKAGLSRQARRDLISLAFDGTGTLRAAEERTPGAALRSQLEKILNSY